ncbi:thiolase family protein [Jatrophihabitans sp. DSM 45814]
MRQAVIVDAVRTGSGRGEARGALVGVHPAHLLATVLLALVDRSGIDPTGIEEIIAGCDPQAAEQAGNIARIACLAAGFAEATSATTVDQHGASSLQALQFGAQAVASGAREVVIAAGVESMSRVSRSFPVRVEERLNWPLRFRYPEPLVNSGVAAELMCARWGIGRAELDEYAARSHEAAALAWRAGVFDNEVIPVDVDAPSGGVMKHSIDETIRPDATVEALSRFRPTFYSDAAASRFPEISWHITKGNTAPRSDGASAVLIMSADRAQSLGLKARATVRSVVSVGSDALLMLSGVIPATQKALQMADLKVADLAAVEINETYAAVPLAWQRAFDVDSVQLNPRGGAIGLGTPSASTGTRSLTTLINHLEQTQGRYGLVSAPGSSGLATAAVIDVG